MKSSLRIAIIGAGPGGMFMFKKLIESNIPNLQIIVYEKGKVTGAGMPYSDAGALDEHVTNVSANEIPHIATPLDEWIRNVDPGILKRFDFTLEKFHEYKVLPRLLFGHFLHDQFRILQRTAKSLNIKHEVFYNTEVTDIIDEKDAICIVAENGKQPYDRVIICTGHQWATTNESKFPGYFDSPYPPCKLAFAANHPVAIKGASLTAIDAIKTLARSSGAFHKNEEDKLAYKRNDDCPNFRLVMHSRNGMLPAVRFHLEDPTLAKDTVLSADEVAANRKQNDGFLSLDYVFEQNFKLPLRDRQPDFYEQIKDMQLEEFVDRMIDVRERLAPFDLLKREYEAAEKSIEGRQSIHWKEMLAVLSFTMNYPAKYFSAEDMLRLRKTLMPLIGLIIAFIPQSSADELIALHDAGILTLVNVGDDSWVEPHDEGGITYHFLDEAGTKRATTYKTFVDCTGQKHLSYQEFPFDGLLSNRVVSPARIKFHNAQQGQQLIDKGNELVSKNDVGDYYLSVPGIAVNDCFQIVDDYNAYNERIYVMAVSLIGGYNPDYSGLDFCDAASSTIVYSIASSQ